MNLMNEPSNSSSVLRPILLAVALAASTAPQAYAVSYATSLTNTGSAVSFRLNEPADVVKVIYNGGSSVLNLGARPAGITTTNVAITGTFQVEVAKTAGAGYLQGTVLQISSDANTLLQWEQPVGVAINRNPASPYFGRIYVSNSRPLPTATGRNVQDGIYVLNPDFTDALGQGDNALTGGLDFSDQTGDNQNTTLPWKIEIGEDDNLYIADFTTNSGTIYVTDPNVANGANVLEGLGTPGISPTAGFTHGQIASSVIATGSLSTSNLTLYALDADVAPVNGLKRFDVNEGPLPSQAFGNDLTGFGSPLLQIARVIVDLERGPDGKFYLLQYRSAGNEAGLYVIDSVDNDQDGYLDLLYSSLGNWREITGDFTTNDYLREIYSIDVAPNGQYLALGKVNGPIYILPLDASGLPILTNRITLNAASAGPTRDVAFDAAGNLYMVNNNIELLRAYSPGGRWVATTGSDGTFTVTNPPVTIPEITISSSQTNMYERVGANTGEIILTRVGSTDEALTVNLQVAGTAVSGTDYQPLPASVVIPVGATSTNVSVTPLNNSTLTGPRTILVTIAPAAGYNIVGSGTLTLHVLDDEQEPGTVVFEDDFETDTSANYNILWSSGDGVQDYSAEFVFDYSQLGIPPAPHSAAGETKGVRLRANKDGTGSPSAVNLFPKGENFSGDYALRADVYMNIGTDAAGTTEHTLFGINHSGNTAVRHGITASDGLWFGIDSDGSNNRGFGFYGTANASAPTLLRGNSEFIWAFPSPPYAFAGAPGNSTNMVTSAGLGGIWADVEVSQIKDVVTAKVNGVVIFQFTNTYAYKNGTVMIGHNDQFASIGSQDTYSLWDNLRVVNFASADLSVRMTDIRASGANLVITFTADTAGAFLPYSSVTAGGPYTVDSAATISTNSPGVYQLTAPATDASRFFRIGRSQ